MAICACESGTSEKSAAAKPLEYSRNLKLGESTAEIRSIFGSDTLVKVFDLSKPAMRIAALSSAQLGYLLRLGAASHIVAVGEKRYVADSALYNSQVASVGYGTELDYERLMALRPDFVMTFATGGANDDYERLGNLGIDAMITSEWQEESPLAKAEWIKLYGAMLGGEFVQRADSIFRGEVRNYEAVKAQSQSGTQACPKVLAGMSYGGVWQAPGGNSYTARLIRDAGGCYLWASDSSRELRLTLEEVMLMADSADLWINPGMFSRPEELVASDPRVESLKPFKAHRVYQNDGRKGPGGGNDFFEGAVARPGELLRNLHDCMTRDDCTYSKKLDGSNATLQGSAPIWYHNIF